MGTMLINAPSKLVFIAFYVHINTTSLYLPILHIHSPYICIHVLHTLEKGFLSVLTSFDKFLFFLYGICQCGIVLFIFLYFHSCLQ